MSNWAVGLRPSFTPYTRMVNQWKGRSPIRSVQTGTISLTGSSSTGTITSVDVNNTLIFITGCNQSSTDTGSVLSRLSITSATQLTATRANTTGTTTVGYVVNEFWPGVIRNVFRNTISMAATVESATDTSMTGFFNTAKMNCCLLGVSIDDSTADGHSSSPRLTITSLTTMTVNRAGGSSGPTGTLVTGYQTWEWW